MLGRRRIVTALGLSLASRLVRWKGAAAADPPGNPGDPGNPNPGNPNPGDPGNPNPGNPPGNQGDENDKNNHDPDKPPPSPGRINKIAIENRKRGNSKKWTSKELKDAVLKAPEKHRRLLTGGPGELFAPFVQPTINGYANAVSIVPGESINFYVSTSQPDFDIDVFRMGWYDGAGSCWVTSASSLPGVVQPTPRPDPNTGFLECNWATSYTLHTDSEWPSGVYLAKLTAHDGSVGYIIFVVRNPNSDADIVVQIPVTTWQAYNSWGGPSSYATLFSGAKVPKVSYNRPYDDCAGAGLFFHGSFNMVRWLERWGYDVTYVTSLDVHTNPNLLDGHLMFLSDRHDEYWSRPMRDNLKRWRDQGKGVAFFDANNIFWQIRFEQSGILQPNRTQVCYKVAEGGTDPMQASRPDLTTTQWREPPLNAPENALLGSMYENFFDFSTAYPWVVQSAAHWVYGATGVRNNDAIPGMVGYEYDKVWNNGATPANLTTLSRSPVTLSDGTTSISNSTVYQAASGAWVFNAGTIDWSWKLDDNEYQMHGPDARIQQMMRNILVRMTGHLPVSPPTPTATAQAQYAVYSDALRAGWGNESWNSTVSLSGTPAYAGTSSIRYTANAPFAGLVLTAPGGNFDPSPYLYFSVAIRGTVDGQVFRVFLFDSSQNVIGNPLYTGNYGGPILRNSWRVYKLPLWELNPDALPFRSIVIQEQAGMSPSTINLDSLTFTT